MSDETPELDELDDLDAPKKSGRLVAVVAAVVAATGGGFLGIQFLGPTVGSMLASEPGAESGDDGHGGPLVDSHGDPIAPVAQIHMIDNLVVNPAGAGTRFLIASIALAPGPNSTVEALASRDIEVRDVLLRLLGSKTVAELSDIEQRDVLAAEMIQRLTDKLGAGVVKHVYMPQFFIQ